MCSWPSEVCSWPSGVRSWPSEVCSWPSEVCSWPSGVHSWPSEVCSWPSGVCLWPGGVCSWPCEVCSWPSGVRSWPSGVCSWPSEVRSWPSEVHSWPSEVRSWPSEVRSWPSEVRSWPSEERSWPSGERSWPSGVCSWPSGVCSWPSGVCSWPSGVCIWLLCNLSRLVSVYEDSFVYKNIGYILWLQYMDIFFQNIWMKLHSSKTLLFYFIYKTFIIIILAFSELEMCRYRQSTKSYTGICNGDLSESVALRTTLPETLRWKLNTGWRMGHRDSGCVYLLLKQTSTPNWDETQRGVPLYRESILSNKLLSDT